MDDETRGDTVPSCTRSSTAWRSAGRAGSDVSCPDYEASAPAALSRTAHVMLWRLPLEMNCSLTPLGHSATRSTGCPLADQSAATKPPDNGTTGYENRCRLMPAREAVGLERGTSFIVKDMPSSDYGFCGGDPDGRGADQPSDGSAHTDIAIQFGTRFSVDMVSQT
jgi:hypothetical protein